MSEAGDESLYLRFREADPTDLPAFTTLIARTMQHTYARPELDIPPEFFDQRYFKDRATQDSYLDQLTASDTNRAWVCQTASSMVVGAITSVAYKTHIQVPKLYVAPRWNRLGIGSILLYLAMDYWGEDRRYMAEVLQYNENGIRFWRERFGFKIEEGVKVVYDFLPEDEWPTGLNPHFWSYRMWREPDTPDTKVA